MQKKCKKKTWDTRRPACAALCKEPQRKVGGAMRKQNHKICCTFSLFLIFLSMISLLNIPIFGISNQPFMFLAVP